MFSILLLYCFSFNRVFYVIYYITYIFYVIYYVIYVIYYYLKEIKSWDDKVVRVQDKGSRFVILENEVYEEKIQQQIDRSSFKELKDDPSKLFQQKINNWIEKWYAKKVIDNSWKDFISCDSPSAGKMYGLVKTHKANNPVRIITGGCNTAV